MDIISLIPIHLASQRDRFHAASVCRHWRRVLLRNGTLWSQLFLMKGEDYVSTLIERAKGSVLDIAAHQRTTAGTLTLISSRAQQIRSLEFTRNYWSDVKTFSESISGRLPLLRILKIHTRDTYTSSLQPGIVTPPSLPFFGGSTNLEQFVFRSRVLPFLSHFVFPNFTTFELSAYPEGECSASSLLDFLKASPTLQTVKVKISPTVVLRGVPQEMVVVLPNVKSFSLQVTHDPTIHVYDVAAHISCPRARDTSLVHGVDNVYVNGDMKIFPTPDSWNVITHQYTASPIKEVTIETRYSESGDLECFLTFPSSTTTVLRSGFKVIETDVHESELDVPRAEIGWEILLQALCNIHDCPLLSRIKRLHIKYNAAIPDTYIKNRTRSAVLELFSSLGPLDKLTIHGHSLLMIFAVLLDDMVHFCMVGHVDFPQVKELAISHPVAEAGAEECMDAVVKLVKSQYLRGKPFERLTINIRDIPEEIEEQLAQWVDIVGRDENGECCD